MHCSFLFNRLSVFMFILAMWLAQALFQAVLILLGGHTQSLTVLCETELTEVLAPPLNVKATHRSSNPNQVEVSWLPSPSIDDSNNITTVEYRLFFESGENVSFPSFVASVGLILDGVTVGQQVLIRSESVNDTSPVYSELVNVTVSEIITNRGGSSTDSEEHNGAAIALGVLLLVVMLLASIPVILLVYILYRMHKLQQTLPHLSSDVHLRVFRKHTCTIIRDPKTSENIAYGSVNILSSLNGSTCTSSEDHQMLVLDRENDGDDVGEDQPHPAYEDVHYNQLED